jgi:hypothetical protein
MVQTRYLPTSVGDRIVITKSEIDDEVILDPAIDVTVTGYATWTEAKEAELDRLIRRDLVLFVPNSRESVAQAVAQVESLLGTGGKYHFYGRGLTLVFQDDHATPGGYPTQREVKRAAVDYVKVQLNAATWAGEWSLARAYYRRLCWVVASRWEDLAQGVPAGLDAGLVGRLPREPVLLIQEEEGDERA